MTLDDHKALFIKELIADIQRRDPQLSFREAWNRLRRDKPNLFESDDEGYDPETEEPGPQAVAPYGTPNTDRMFQKPLWTSSSRLAGAVGVQRIPSRELSSPANRVRMLSRLPCATSSTPMSLHGRQRTVVNTDDTAYVVN